LVSGLDVIGKWSKDLTPEQFAELIQIAQVSVDRLKGQIEDILHYTQLPVLSQKQSYFSLEELPKLIGRIALEVEVDTVFLTAPHNMDSYLITPAYEMMELVLYELFENAHKFHPETMPVVEIEVAQQAKMIRLTVSDNGRYLAPEHIDRVWMPYYQAEKTFTGEVPGMGLGLSIVSSLIWQVDGECRLYNRVDKPGVTIELLLPIAPTSTKAAMDASEVVVPAVTFVTTRIL
jgi:K+-sensing histidine kinase KdpD